MRTPTECAANVDANSVEEVCALHVNVHEVIVSALWPTVQLPRASAGHVRLKMVRRCIPFSSLRAREHWPSNGIKTDTYATSNNISINFNE